MEGEGTAPESPAATSPIRAACTKTPLVTTAPRRILSALAGGATAAILVALVEAGVAGEGTPAKGGPGYGALFVADAAVLVPLALVVAMAVAGVAVFLEPGRSRSLAEHVEAVRAQPVLRRARNAALAPLSILGALAWTTLMAHVARDLLSHGSPLPAGTTLAAAGIAAALVVGVVVLAFVRPLRRALAFASSAADAFLDPVVTGGVALVAAVGILALGVHLGDTGGEGGTLEIFGVLKRSELDLRPLANLVAMAMGAYLAQVAFGRRTSVARAVACAGIVGASLLITLREAQAMNDDPASVRAVERGAPLGKTALSVLRHLTDRDHDGASALFGGGDCDDGDPRRSPSAIDVPDNGIDEDCSGSDLHVDRTPRSGDTSDKSDKAVGISAKRAGGPPDAPRLPPDLNLVFLTVDTLRIDVGFMGYPKPTTPNLDKLAEKGVVFDRMYSMASYTGKSIGPLFIGKYPSETKRDGGHFNTYLPPNTFLEERLQKAGIHTLGAAAHWYFMPWSGLSQGMDTWDLQARPTEGQGDNDTSITSKDLSDEVIRLLKKPETTQKRFFLWAHYFDPHEQYMPHDGAPDFGRGSKAAYDGEVWFTDKHIGRVLDYIASQPWGAKTAVILTADHGEAFGEHNMRWHGYELWETLVRVPFLVYVPGVTPHHVPVKRSHIDVVPTVLDLMGVPQPPEGELSGESMIDDVLAGPDHDYEERDVFMDMPVGPFNGQRHALIHGKTPGEKIIRLETGQFQLFDLNDDPAEAEDLSGDKEKMSEMVPIFQAKRGTLKEIEVKPLPPP
jgi:arylsulfatase A-like enzyme